jgi:hypothetical protein
MEGPSCAGPSAPPSAGHLLPTTGKTTRGALENPRPCPSRSRSRSSLIPSSKGTFARLLKACVLLLGDMMAAVLVQLEGHAGHPGGRGGVVLLLRPSFGRHQLDPCNNACSASTMLSDADNQDGRCWRLRQSVQVMMSSLLSVRLSASASCWVASRLSAEVVAGVLILSRRPTAVRRR